jgi:hypothetical protein
MNAKEKSKKAAQTELRPGQVRILKALKSGKAMTGAALAKAAEVDASMIGNLAGYRNAEINRRPVHAGNLLNRKLVTLREEEAGYVYSITPAGAKALSEAKG